MGMIYKRKQSQYWWVKYYRAGKVYRESSNSTKESDARRLLRIREGRIAEGRPMGIRPERVTFDELAADLLNDYEVNGKKSTPRAKQAVNKLKEFFGGFRVVDVTTDRIRVYIKHRQDQGKGEKNKPVANGTINRELRILKRMFNLGTQNTPPKVERLPFIPMLEENNARSGFFEHDEFLSLRGALPDHAKIPATIAYYTGMRLGEILGLRWDQVDLKEGKILLSPDQTKNKTARMIYFSGELYEALSKAWEIRERKCPSCIWVCQKGGKQLKSFRRSWKTALETIGIEGRLFHDFRRTGVRNMVRAGIPEKVAMTISGHKTRSVFERYNIVSESDLKAAAEKIGTFHRKKSQDGRNETGTVSGTDNDPERSEGESIFTTH